MTRGREKSKHPGSRKELRHVRRKGQERRPGVAASRGIRMCAPHGAASGQLEPAWDHTRATRINVMKNIYLFSGLGADERAFQRLDFGDCKPAFIKWIEPHRKESIEQYAKRLVGQITSENPVLVGLSFGGMIAIEVAKQIDTESLILISTAKTRGEIPWYYRLAGKLKLHKLIPAKFRLKSSIFGNWFFGANTNFERKLLRQILDDTDIKFVKWAIDTLVRWKNTTLPNRCMHIHGSKDRILPVRFVQCDIAIEGGGHLMVLTHSATLNEIIQHLLEQ